MTFLRSRLKAGVKRPGSQLASQPLDPLHDEDQPFIYDIRFSKKWFTLECYDTANPNQHWTTLNPDVVVLAFDISNRDTLENLKTVSCFSLSSGFLLACYFFCNKDEFMNMTTLFD